MAARKSASKAMPKVQGSTPVRKPRSRPKAATKKTAKARPTPAAASAKPKPRGARSAVVLLTGGNPQIAKADGDAPVQAYIAAMPGWKSAIGKRLDALIVQAVPNVRKAVKWNTPLYGIQGQGWFLGFNVLTRAVKLTFFKGASLQPLPPGPSKTASVRYFSIYEDDTLDEGQLVRWVKQAAAIPGWLTGSSGIRASSPNEP